MIIIIALPTSKFLLSIGMILVIFSAVLNVFQGKKELDFKFFNWKNPYFWIMMVFLIHLPSFLYSDDIGYFLERIRIRLPFLLLPGAFYFAPKLTKKQINICLATFCGLISITIIGCLINFAFDYEAILKSYEYAKVLPTPISHVRFSLMVGFSAFVGFYLWKRKIFFIHQSESIVHLVCAVLAIVFLHILSVRSGLVAFYLTGFVFGVYYFIQQKKYQYLIVLGIAIITLPIIALQFSPTLSKKMSYMRYDLEQYMNGKSVSMLSDSRRLVSYEAALNVSEQNLIFGVGCGDMKQEVFKFYQEKYPELESKDWVLPHNQFLIILSGMGIVGLLLFLFSFLVPVFIQNGYPIWFYAFLMIILLSFIVEGTIENQIGTAFVILFYLLGIQFAKLQE